MPDFVTLFRVPTFADLQATYNEDPQQAFTLALRESTNEETGLMIDGRDLTPDEMASLRLLFGNDTPERRSEVIKFVLHCAHRSSLDFKTQGFLIIDGLATMVGEQAACTPDGNLILDYDFFNTASLAELWFTIGHEMRHAAAGKWDNQRRTNFTHLSYLQGAPRTETRALVEQAKRDGLYRALRHEELESDIHAIAMFDSIDEGLAALNSLVNEMDARETEFDSGEQESLYRSLHPSPKLRLRHAYMHFKGHRPPKV